MATKFGFVNTNRIIRAANIPIFNVTTASISSSLKLRADT